MSGPNSTFNRFVERTKDDWDTGTKLLSGYLIQNYINKYNNMVAAKEWTKTDPKDSKILSLTTMISKLYQKKLLPLKYFKEEEATEPIPAPTIN